MEERTIVSFDYAVKYLLRDKADFGILSGFLSELLRRDVVVDAILESESNKNEKAGKTNRVDMKARIDGGELAVFEFQFHEEIDFFDRVLFGVSKAVVEQVSAGGKYDIKKVYSINVSYYNLGAKRDYLFLGRLDGFRGLNFEEETLPFGRSVESDSEADSDGAKADIHPEYYLILPNMFDERLKNRFDEWVYVLKKSAVRSDFTAAGIKEAEAKLDLLKMSHAERVSYESYLDNKSSLDCTLRTAIMNGEREGLRKGLKKGEARGLKKGEAKGRKEGLAEGRKEGLAEGERNAKMELAKKMKDEGVAVSVISKVTELSVDDIKKL